MINGSWTEELTIVKEAVRGFFLKCFQEPDFARPRLDGSTFKTIHSLQNDMLVGRFQEDEVKKVVWSCGSEESPGPDGLNFKFIKQFWHVFQPDL